MLPSRFRVLLVLAAFLLAAPGFIATAEHDTLAQDTASAPLAAAMPADVSLYLATDFNLRSDQYLQVSGLTARMLLPIGGDTVSAIVEKLTGLIALIPSDLRRVLEGEIGIGVEDWGDLGLNELDSAQSLDPSGMIDAAVPGYAVILHPLQAAAARPIVEAWFTSQLEQAGLEPQRSQAGPIVVLRTPALADSPIPGALSVVVFVGDYILLGASYDDLLPFVEAVQGSVPTLADSEDFQTLGAALPSERLLFGYLNGESLTRSVDGLFDASSVESSIDVPIGKTAFTVATDDSGYRFESASKRVSGTGAPARANTPNPGFDQLVPDTTLALIAGQNLGQSWAIEQLQKLLLSAVMGSMGTDEAGSSNVNIDAEFSMLAMLTGINFKKDLFDQLEGDYGVALFSIDTAAPLSISVVIASDLGDANRVSVGVTSLGPLIQSSAAGLASVTTASVAGQTVNNVSFVGSDPGTTIQYGVVNGQLMVGLGAGIATLADTPVISLADSPSYQAARDELPPNYDGLLYVDLQSIAQALTPILIESATADSDNPLAVCAAQLLPTATPGPGTLTSDGAVSGICSFIGGVLGEGALGNFVASRFPGPLTAVTYQADGLQRVSGILMVGSES